MEKTKISSGREPGGSTLQNRPSPPQIMLSFTARRLLTEKSSVKVNASLLDAETERLTMSAAFVAAVTTEIRGYSHYGLND